jgi:hypothetical protein
LAAGVDWELSRGLPPVGSKLIDRDSEWEDHKTRWTVADPIACMILSNTNAVELPGLSATVSHDLLALTITKADLNRIYSSKSGINSPASLH